MALLSTGDYVESGYVVDSYVYEDPPVTLTGPVGLPISYDYEATRTSVPTIKEYTGPVTGVSALGLPQLVLGSPGVDVTERRDTLVARQDTPRTGDLSVSERVDTLSADGSVEQVAGTANLWFNADWFNGSWFNANWFNASTVKTGNVNVTEQPDSAAGTLGHVNINGSANILELPDTATTYGSAGIDVTGNLNITEASDFRKIEGRLLVTGTISVIEGADTLDADGALLVSGVPVQIVRLTWQQVGTMTRVRIYRSSDNITFTNIADVAATTLTYSDKDVPISGTYYYYLVGETTTDVIITSDTVSATVSNEIISDWQFVDPNAWNIHANAGSVSNGTLVISPVDISSGRQVSPVIQPTLVENVSYDWEIKVNSSSVVGNMQFAVGGTVIWAQNDGAGTFSGTLVADGVAGGGPVNPFGYGVTLFLNTIGPTTNATFEYISVQPA